MDYTTYEKDQDYYFSDGNICIVVEQVIFRVHQQPLARQSTVFRDMFAVPPPKDGVESFEGVAVVKLADKLGEVRALLQFMHGDIPLGPTFEVIDNALRISHKYDATRLTTWGVTHLRKYPTATAPILLINFNKEWTNYKADPTLPARLINLTQLLDKREFDGQAALAYYALSMVGWKSYDPEPIYRSSDTCTLARLTSGRSKLLSRVINVIQDILKHQCKAGDTIQSFMPLAVRVKTQEEEGSCRKTKDLVLQNLTSQLHGDIVHALQFPSGPLNCIAIMSLMVSGAGSIYSSICVDFGFSGVSGTI
ncbi:hypothetical protein FRB93_007428 [Tulasnella sp. JGI-2019a]|nr:hypothetical protein FRB93_007428 [Tulasnella sp. JGI-2019a]